jgi:hypothetical protein
VFEATAPGFLADSLDVTVVAGNALTGRDFHLTAAP